jgi:hypothetical protein
LKTSVALVCSLLISFYSFSQADSTTIELDTVVQRKKITELRTSSHYLGVQANQLIKQLLNFSNSSTVIDNPYLITYSVNSKKTGVGFSSGLGYSINEFSDGDQTNKRNTKINNFSFRIGFEKKSNLGKKWFASWGVDLVQESSKNETSSSQSQLNNPDIKFNSNSTNKSSLWGLGPRFTLNFRITEKIILGTEATYYYKSGTNSTQANTTSTQQEFDPQIGQLKLVTRTTNTPETSTDFTTFKFVIPTVLYLIVKF